VVIVFSFLFQVQVLVDVKSYTYLSIGTLKAKIKYSLCIIRGFFFSTCRAVNINRLCQKLVQLFTLKELVRHLQSKTNKTLS